MNLPLPTCLVSKSRNQMVSILSRKLKRICPLNRIGEESHIMKDGLTQGTLQSPQLFLIYINDLKPKFT